MSSKIILVFIIYSYCILIISGHVMGNIIVSFRLSFVVPQKDLLINLSTHLSIHFDYVCIHDLFIIYLSIYHWQ